MISICFHREVVRVDWVETRSQHYTLNSAEICPIKPNRFSTEPSSNDRLAEALRTRNPQWTTRALWYPPAQSRRHLPNAHEAAPGRYRNQAVKIHSPEDSVVPLSSMRCSHPAARPTDAAPALHIHNLNRHEGRQGKIKHQRSGLPKGIGIVAAHCERCRQCLRVNIEGASSKRHTRLQSHDHPPYFSANLLSFYIVLHWLHA